MFTVRNVPAETRDVKIRVFLFFVLWLLCLLA